MGPEPFSNFLADCHVMDAADLIAIFVRGISHEISSSRQRRTEVRKSSAPGGHKASFQNFRASVGRPQT
jgi:hypothetical protein